MERELPMAYQPAVLVGEGPRRPTKSGSSGSNREGGANCVPMFTYSRRWAGWFTGLQALALAEAPLRPRFRANWAAPRSH